MAKRRQKPRPTAQQLRELYEYDPETGHFYHRRRRAGTRSTKYEYVSFGNKNYRAHHLAWLYMTGEWPDESKFVDHRNLNKRDNRFSNLRLATKSQNAFNKPKSPHNSSGLKGAFRHKAGAKYGKPWQSAIMANGQNIFLGHFATAQEAHEAYCAAAKKYHGEFARID